jgi:predicted RNase H-like HicB family nuclease
MVHKNDRFTFTNALFKGEKGFWVLCLDLDVATQGSTPAETKKNLLEAIELYLETAIENNQPFLRPVPPEEDPRRTKLEGFVETFNLKIAFSVKAHA